MQIAQENTELQIPTLLEQITTAENQLLARKYIGRTVISIATLYCALGMTTNLLAQVFSKLINRIDEPTTYLMDAAIYTVGTVAGLYLLNRNENGITKLDTELVNLGDQLEQLDQDE